MEEFLQVMRTGTREQQQDAVMDLIDWQSNYDPTVGTAIGTPIQKELNRDPKRILGRRDPNPASVPVEGSADGRSLRPPTGRKAPNESRSPSDRDSQAIRPAPEPRRSESRTVDRGPEWGRPLDDEGNVGGSGVAIALGVNLAPEDHRSGSGTLSPQGPPGSSIGL